ncbi:hypothetical protein [Companilactobacillus nantensis]|nr:hypothetical protein [Companilactobacillus nantensis]GEO64787.1 hypothetical protein LNA01_19700 [Companilactobacillus nantensis]
MKNDEEYITTPKVKLQGLLNYVPSNFIALEDFEAIERSRCNHVRNKM